MNGEDAYLYLEIKEPIAVEEIPQCTPIIYAKFPIFYIIEEGKIKVLRGDLNE
jgi:hypothetical protein